MSDTIEPMKCELCGERPEDCHYDGIFCNTKDCPLEDKSCHSYVSWNALQTALIELQREAIKYALWREYDREPAPYKVDDLLRDYLAQRSAK